MAQFTRADRQRIIDEYLAASGENLFQAHKFIDWLADHPDHEAYPWFFSKDDAAAAREYRIGLARQMASGLRIQADIIQPKQSNVGVVVTKEFPAYVSPIAQRNNGGGYQRFNPQDTDDIAELRRQGQTALRSWIARYGGAFTEKELDQIRKIAAAEADRVALSA